MTTAPFHILRSGYDTLELAYAAALPFAFIDCLKDAQARAIKQHNSEPVEFNGLSFLVEASGGQGGYRYRVSTGKLGAIWKFKESNRSDPWTTHVKLRAYGLALKGLEESKTECDSFLKTTGARFDANDARVSRADYAVDVYAPGFRIEKSNFVTHARRGKSEFTEENSVGDIITGIRIGKMPNLQLAIYDKSRKVTSDRDRIWEAIFEKLLKQITTRDFSNVWRFEFRAGKNWISQKTNPRRWDLFESRQHAIFEEIGGRISLRTPNGDTNRSRWPIAPQWQSILREVTERIELPIPFELPPEVLARIRDEYRDGLDKQLEGLLISRAASEGVSIDTFREFISEHTKHAGDRLMARTDVHNELERRVARLDMQ